MPKTFRQELLDILSQPVKTFTYAGREEHLSSQSFPVLLDEIEQAVRQLIERAKPTPETVIHKPTYEETICEQNKLALDEFHSNLLAEINGSPDKDS